MSTKGKWEKLNVNDEEEIQTYIQCQMLVNSIGICDATRMNDELVIPLITQTKKEGEAWIYQDNGFVAVFGVRTITWKEKYKLVSVMTYPITLETWDECVGIIAERIIDHMKKYNLTHMEASTYILKNWETSIYYNIGIETPEEFISMLNESWQNLEGDKLSYSMNESGEYLDIYLEEE